MMAAPEPGEKPNGKAAAGAPTVAKARGNGSASVPAMTLPYLEFSHALMRAADFRAMTEANRKLTDAVREVLRRQQDLAWELAESAMGRAEVKPGEVFDRAAAAVRELGEAMIDAQIGALRTLQAESPDQKGESRNIAPKR